MRAKEEFIQIQKSTANTNKKTVTKSEIETPNVKTWVGPCLAEQSDCVYPSNERGTSQLFVSTNRQTLALFVHGLFSGLLLF